MIKIIETKRLVIREFTINDYHDLYTFSSLKIVQKYTGDPVLKSHSEAKHIILSLIKKDYKKYGYGRWAIILKSNNQLIGAAGLKYLSEINETDIGYRLLPSYWKKGIATEAAYAITKYGFQKLKLTRILGFVIPENISSCKVLEKTGYHFMRQFIYPTDKKIYNWYYKLNN